MASCDAYGGCNGGPYPPERSGVHADDFVAILRHLSDAASREASSASSRLARCRAVAGQGFLLDDAPGYLTCMLARVELLFKGVQDLINFISFCLCLVVLKVALRVVGFRRSCRHMCCRMREDGKVDGLTSLQWRLTSTIMQLQGLCAEHAQRSRELADFLARHRISVALATRVKKYVDRSLPHQIRESNIEGMRRISTQLLVDLHEEMRVPALSVHPFFVNLRAKHPHLVRELYQEALEPMLRSTDEMVFCAGEACCQMYFVVSGHVLYTGNIKETDPQKTADGQYAVTQIRRTLHGGQWLSEAALWTGWVHRGELRVVADCFLFALSAAGFARVISSHKSAHVFAAGYARKFVETLNRGPQTDLVEAAPVDQ